MEPVNNIKIYLFHTMFYEVTLFASSSA